MRECEVFGRCAAQLRWHKQHQQCPCSVWTVCGAATLAQATSTVSMHWRSGGVRADCMVITQRDGQPCSAVDAVRHLFLCFLLRLGICLGLVRRLFGFEFQSLGLFLLLLGRHRRVRIARLTRPLIASLQLGSCCSKVETQQESRARVAAACGLTQPFLSPHRARKIFCAYSNRRFDASEHLWAVVQALGVGGGAHPRAEKTSQSSQVLRSCRSKRGPKNNLL
jgi:hypothetical protein